MNKSTLIVAVVCVLLLVGIVISSSSGVNPEVRAEYTAFAQCLDEEGATFYGAFWCPHCIAQKRLFEGADKDLPYVECSLPDRRTQTQVCIDAEITGYPTWEFADGERVSGAQPLQLLAERTGCPLPASFEAPVVVLEEIGESSDVEDGDDA